MLGCHFYPLTFKSLRESILQTIALGCEIFITLFQCRFHKSYLCNHRGFSRLLLPRNHRKRRLRLQCRTRAVFSRDPDLVPIRIVGLHT